MNETENNKQLVRDFLEVLGVGDVDAAFAYFAEDVSWWLAGSLPTSGTYLGKQAIIEGMLAKGAERVDPSTMRMEVRTLIGDGKYVNVEWISRFTTLKGHDYENFYNVMFEVENGKIQTIREYMDTQYAKEVLFAD